MKKIFSTIIINILIFASLLFLVEVGIWAWENETLRRMNDSYRAKGLLKFHQGIKPFKLDAKHFPTPENGWGRAPEGLDFKQKPIVFFGCSFTYGMNLEKEQTLPYKFAYLTKHPTYNRAFSSWGIQHMLYQTKLEEIYSQIPEPEYVIYTIMHDHFRRLYILTFMRGQMLNEDFNLRYKEKDGKLYEIKNKNHLFNFIKRLYLTNVIYNHYVEKIKLRAENGEEYTNFALKHFIESKEEMQKHWKDTKYVVYFYDYEPNYDLLKNKLEKEDFIIIDNKDLTKEDLTTEKYMFADYHPKEAAWDLLTPKIIEKLGI